MEDEQATWLTNLGSVAGLASALIAGQSGDDSAVVVYEPEPTFWEQYGMPLTVGIAAASLLVVLLKR
jgi:hypothetical protein